MTVDDMLLATPSPGTLGGRFRAVGLGCDGEPAVVVDLREATADAFHSLEDEVAMLRSVVLAVLEDGPDDDGVARARPWPYLTPAQGRAVARAMEGVRT